MQKLRHLFVATVSATALLIPISLSATLPTVSPYNCQGSLKPYPAPETLNTYPDSLTPVFINHVGRHGARYPAGSAHALGLMKLLNRADSLKTITPLGRQLKAITAEVIKQSTGRWGALDSLGMAEHRGIASRMVKTFPSLFKGKNINAISSYSPRAMMSMFSFVHEIDDLNNSSEISTLTGRSTSPLMRFFDVNQSYITFIKDKTWEKPYKEYIKQTIPLDPIYRVVGKRYKFESDDEARDAALLEYYVLAGLNAMSMPADGPRFFTDNEYTALWSCFNLRQYLQRTSTSVSTIPADIASPLLQDLIVSTDLFIMKPAERTTTVQLRFGHAETLMPLLSLMKVPGCNYYTDNFESVAQNWQDFYVVPMAANLQMILFQAQKSGKYYVATLLNEHPVNLVPEQPTIVPWDVARDYLVKCIH